MEKPIRAYGLVKNVTAVDHQLGSHRIPGHTIGRLPIEIVEDLRRWPIQELVVIQDHPDLIPFVRTEHLPFGPRYRK